MTNKTSDIEMIISFGYNEIAVYFVDGAYIHTTGISFNSDGTFETGYIYN